MRLTLHTDYALRVLVHVGLRDGELVTINDIADSYQISKNHLTKVVHQLGRAGYLETVRGKYGGVRLMMDPQAICLGDFIRQTEEDFALARCLDDNECQADQCRISSSCLARVAYGKGLKAFFTELNRVTIGDMINAERQRNEPCRAVG